MREMPLQQSCLIGPAFKLPSPFHKSFKMWTRWGRCCGNSRLSCCLEHPHPTSKYWEIQVPATSALDPAPCSCIWEEQMKEIKYLSPCHPCGTPRLSSWLQPWPSPIPAVAVISGVNQWKEDLFFSLYLPLSFWKKHTMLSAYPSLPHSQ